MQTELLLVPECPHATVAADLVATAVKDTGVKATITQVTMATEERARDRGFTGSPTILLGSGRDHRCTTSRRSMGFGASRQLAGVLRRGMCRSRGNDGPI